jgi:retron-type reverse transcriptase
MWEQVRQLFHRLLGRRTSVPNWQNWWTQEQARRRQRRAERRERIADYWGLSEKERADWRALGEEPEVPGTIINWRERLDYLQEKRRELREKRASVRTGWDRKVFGEELWGVSEAHRRAGADEAKLNQLGLPVLRTEAALAEWLGISLPRLRWFTHDKPGDTVWHYVRRTIPKRDGGERVILAPKRQLKALQRKVLRDLLAKVPLAEPAHGFRIGRSITSNAQPHAGRAVVLNLDLKDFFPSITYPRVRGLVLSLGYPFSVASALALLCTERDREAFDHDGKRYYVGVSPRALVQGAPTSPVLANLVARRLDRRLNGVAAKNGFTYTRYADDLSFSGDDPARALRVLDIAQRVIGEEKFAVNPAKTRLFRRSCRQVVTGLVVNDRPAVPRRLRRRLRAILHNAAKTGLAAQNREGREDFANFVSGLIGHIHAVNPRHAEKLRAAFRRLR